MIDTPLHRRARRPARMPQPGPPAEPDANKGNKDKEPGSASPGAPKPKTESKIGQVLSLLQREQGATLAEMVAATGWQPHTTRAALTGLKKKGHAITRDKREEVTCYRISGAA